MDTSGDWGTLPSAAELQAADDSLPPIEMAKLLVRSLHLPQSAWSTDEDTAAPLRLLMERCAQAEDGWCRLVAASLSDYGATGVVKVGQGETLASAARQLAVSLSSDSQGNSEFQATGAIAAGFSLRREAPVGIGRDHFQTRPSALAALVNAFKPLDPPAMVGARAPSTAAPAARTGAAPTAATAGGSASGSGSSLPSASSASSAAGGAARVGAGAGAPTAGRGSGSTSRVGGRGGVSGGSAALLSSRSRGTMSSTAMGRPGGAAGAAGLSGRSGVGGVGAKRPKMMMMDMDEAAAKVIAASTATRPKKEAAKASKAGAGAAGKKGSAAAGDGTKEPDPFEGAVVDAATGLVNYYQDRRKKWTYATDATGGALLRGMIAQATPLIRTVLSQLPEGHEARGKAIYAQKPNLGANGVTWSQQDYGHLGLQAEYLRLKSIQRFTEGWAAMQRSYNAGALREFMGEGEPRSVPLRVASFGGGPGFEMVAVRAFCERYLPRAAPEFASLDLATEWAPCANALGMKFAEWNVNDGDGVLRAAGWPKIDLAIISYVLYHYMSNEHCAEWLSRRIGTGEIGKVLIISRFEELEYQIESVERRGVRVVKLMRQPRYSARKSTDHRQMLYLPASTPPPRAACRERATTHDLPQRAARGRQGRQRPLVRRIGGIAAGGIDSERDHGGRDHGHGHGDEHGPEHRHERAVLSPPGKEHGGISGIVGRGLGIRSCPCTAPAGGRGGIVRGAAAHDGVDTGGCFERRHALGGARAAQRSPGGSQRYGARRRI
jgi:hypothetical protein